MPKYDAKTIERIIACLRTMQICCSMTEDHMKMMDLWDDLVEQYQDGMLDAYSNIINLLIEMKNTSKAKDEKA